MKDENLNEQLSAMLDDELGSRSAQSLLNRLDRDHELDQQYRRFAVASAIMRARGGLTVIPARDFLSRVHDAIEDEPVILAPRSARKPSREKFVSLALAASLVAVAVLGNSVSRLSGEAGADLLARSEPEAVSKADPEFRAYLAMHNETSYLSGSQGMMSSVRLVSDSGSR